MKDTTAGFEALYDRLLMEKTAGERLAMACGMFDAARSLARASIAEAGRGAGDDAAPLFLRFYGDDFDEPRRERIVARLRSG